MKPTSLNHFLKNEYTFFLGIDFGEKFIGLARGQKITKTATAWQVLPNNSEIFDKFKNCLKEYKADALVIGIPVGSKGEALFTTALVEKFATQLKKKFNLPIFFVDERYTTTEINTQFKNSKFVSQKVKKSRKDALSAELILNQFFAEQLSDLH